MLFKDEDYLIAFMLYSHQNEWKTKEVYEYNFIDTQTCEYKYSVNYMFNDSTSFMKKIGKNVNSRYLDIKNTTVPIPIVEYKKGYTLLENEKNNSLLMTEIQTIEFTKKLIQIYIKTQSNILEKYLLSKSNSDDKGNKNDKDFKENKDNKNVKESNIDIDNIIDTILKTNPENTISIFLDTFGIRDTEFYNYCNSDPSFIVDKLKSFYINELYSINEIDYSKEIDTFFSENDTHLKDLILLTSYCYNRLKTLYKSQVLSEVFHTETEIIILITPYLLVKEHFGYKSPYDNLGNFIDTCSAFQEDIIILISCKELTTNSEIATDFLQRLISINSLLQISNIGIILEKIGNDKEMQIKNKSYSIEHSHSCKSNLFSNSTEIPIITSNVSVREHIVKPPTNNVFDIKKIYLLRKTNKSKINQFYRKYEIKENEIRFSDYNTKGGPPSFIGISFTNKRIIKAGILSFIIINLLAVSLSIIDTIFYFSEHAFINSIDFLTCGLVIPINLFMFTFSDVQEKLKFSPKFIKKIIIGFWVSITILLFHFVVKFLFCNEAKVVPLDIVYCSPFVKSKVV